MADLSFKDRMVSWLGLGYDSADDETEENEEEEVEEVDEIEETPEPAPVPIRKEPVKPLKPIEKEEPARPVVRPRMNLEPDRPRAERQVSEAPQPKKSWFNTGTKWQTTGQTNRGANRSKTVLNVQANVKMDISIETPENFDEARDLCARLQQKQPIVINLESIDLDMAQRLTDFLCGACYALRGKVQQIAGKIYMLTPENVDFEADEDFRRTLESEGKINLDDK